MYQCHSKEMCNKTGKCDETCDPLLDQGLVEVSGSFVLLTFASER